MSEIFKLRFQAELEGQDTFDKFFASGERGSRSMQSAIKGALADTARDIKSFVAGMGRDLAAASGLKLGIAANARDVLEFRNSLQRLVIMAQVGDDQIDSLKKQILDVARVSNQAAPAVESALEAFVEKTGDIDTARKNLALYAQVATATASSLEDVASVGVELSRKLNVKDQAAAFGILAQQAKQGAIELRNLAGQGPRIFSAGAALGLTGEKGVREAGALSQVYIQAFGGRGASAAASAATAVERTFLDITQKHDKVTAAGVTAADPVEAVLDLIRKNRKGTARETAEAISDLGIFDSRAMRGIRILANEYQSTGKFGSYESFRDVTPNSGQIASDAQRAMSTGTQALVATQNKIFAETEKHLGDIAEIAAKNSALAAKAYGLVLEHPLLAASAGAGSLFAVSLAKRALLGGGFGGQGAIGKALGIGGGAVPVQVMNWPGSFGGAGGGAGAAGGASGWILRGLGLSIGEFALLAAPVAISAAALIYAQHSKDKLVDQLVEGDRAYAERIKNDPEFRKSESDKLFKLRGTTRRHGGMVIAEPGASMGELDDAGSLPIRVEMEIHDHEVTAVAKHGTRSTKAKIRRHGGGG